MTLVSTGQITLVDLNDQTYALLTSDSGLVPVDASGVPKTPLSSSPLTTQMSVYKGGVLQSGWVFSRAEGNTTSSIHASTGVLTVTAISANSCYVDITASKSGEPSITKRYNIAKVYQGIQGTQGPTGQTGAVGPAGTPALMGVLSNDSHVVPTDKDGNNGNFTGCESIMSIFSGATDDSTNWIVSFSPSAGITGTPSASNRKYAVTGMSVDTGYVDFTATRSGYPSITCRFTISKSKQGTVGATGATGASAVSYWLVSSVAAIGRSLVGVYTPGSITLTAKSQTGSASPANYSGRFIIRETVDGSAWTVKYTSSANEYTKTHTPSQGITALKCELYLAGGTSVLLDEEIIPVVMDGAEGPQGEQGDQGPAGTPRMLGVHTLGLQIQLRGFLDDGTFGYSSGYVYIGSERATVGQADYTVGTSATRSGFIIIDTSYTPRFVTITPNGTGVTEWRDFNTASLVANPYAVIGEFNVANQAVTANMITPMLCEAYVKRHFMSLMADETSGDIDKLNKWAEAVGAERMFTAMAAIEAFINLLRVNHLEVTSGGLNFFVSPDGYQDSG